MSDIPLDEVVHFDVVCHDPATGAVSDADSTPAFAIYEETTDTDIGVGGSLTKRTSLTGNYRGSFTASAANGFEVGKFYSIIASATVGGVAGKAVVKNFRIASSENTAGYPVVDVGRINGSSSPAAVLGQWMASGTPSLAADSGTTTTIVDAALTEDDDYWNGALLVFRSGPNAGIARIVTDFDAASDTLTFAEVPTAVTTDSYMLIPFAGALLTSLGFAQADLKAVDGIAGANIGRGTVDSGASTTSVPTSAFTPAGAVADQFKDRVILFDDDTTTAALRGCARQITASSNAAAPTFTVAALPATPASGDTFSVV